MSQQSISEVSFPDPLSGLPPLPRCPNGEFKVITVVDPELPSTTVSFDVGLLEQFRPTRRSVQQDLLARIFSSVVDGRYVSFLTY